MTVATRRLRAVQIIAAVVIGLVLLATFRTGLARDLHSTFADQSWGRVQFAVGAAITSLYHGGYGYTISDVVRTLLASGGLTGDPIMLKYAAVTFPDNLRNPTLMESAIKKAIGFSWPFNPNEQVTGSSGEDVGLVDYVRLSFVLFSHKLVGFFLTYFLLVGASFVAAIVAFRKSPGILALFVLYAIALFVLFKCNLLDFDMVGILDPRFLSTVSLVPAAHIALAMAVRLRPSAGQIALVVLQSAILIFGYWIRTSAAWTMLGLTDLAIVMPAYALWRREPKPLVRIWPFAAVALLAAGHFIYVAHALHPIYQSPNERPHHALWHALIYGVAIHPGWPTKYAAQFGLEDVDGVPDVVAKKYLERHPPDNPDAVYLTPDRQHLRIGVAEVYKRKGFLELVANDPGFVLEAFLIYNPKLCIKAFRHYLSSFDRVFARDWIAVFLACIAALGLVLVNPGERWRFLAAILIATGGFLASMAPMLITAPGPATLADQFFMLIVVAVGWVVVVVSFVVGLLAAILFGARTRARAGAKTGERDEAARQLDREESVRGLVHGEIGARERLLRRSGAQ